MRYKGFKQMKCTAVVILSAAIVLTDVSGVFAAEYEQTLETEAAEETTQGLAEEDTVAEDVAVESGTLQESVEISDEIAETQPEISHTEENENTGNNTDAGQTASDFSGEIEPVETEEPETVTMEVETDPSETEMTETEETKQQESDASVPVPDIDDSVYEPENMDYTYIDNATPFVSYNVGGTLGKNEQGEYSIDNKDQFLLFLSAETDYSDSTVNLNCDVDMKGETAHFSKTFEGKFVGNGHSIYNYKANGALFKGIGVNGEVTGLHLNQVTFLQEQATAALTMKNDGKISNITVHTDIRITNDMTTAAGIVLENSGEISNCVFAGNITADSGTNNIGKAIGGIVSSNMGRVINCHTLGSIQTNGTEIGGIASRNSKTIENCTNHMTIEGAYCVGGIAAENTGTVSGCSNYGTITQNSSSDEGLAGGIAGKNTEKISDCENYAEISGAYKNIGGIAGSSSGEVTKCGNYGEVSGAENIGGIVGLFSGTNRIQGSFNTGRIDVKINNNSQGIGGILGASSKSAVVIIEDCYNKAIINGANAKYLGGIVGVLYQGSIKNVYNTGVVSAADVTNEFNPYAATVAGFMGPEGDAECAGCLILEGIGDVLYYRQTGEVRAENEKFTSAELKGASALSRLGDGFASDENNINDGYPMIKEQRAQSHKYIVVYEPNGGCADYYFNIVQNGGTISRPASPIKRSASFEGWFVDRSCATEYTFSNCVTQSMVLYAGWESGKLAEDITLNQTEVELVSGETFHLKDKVQFEPASAENRTLVFTSDNPSIAKVDDEGMITAVSEGTTTIRVKMADNSLDKVLAFKVTVSGKANIVRFRLYNDKSNTAEFTRLSIAVNDPVVVEAVFGVEPPKGSTVKWSSVNSDYVKINERSDLANSNAVELEALKPTAGLNESSTEILCTLIYPDQKTIFTSFLKVTVKPLAERVSVQAGKEDATDKTVIYDIGTKKFIAVNETKLSEPTDTLSATVAPNDANQKVKWSSSDSYVIKFDNEESGKADSRVVGEATVTATSTDGSKDKDGKPIAGKTTVKVRRIIQNLSFTPKPMDGNGSVSVDKNGRIEIAEGSSIKLVPAYTPVDATEKTIKWTNGNKNAIELTKVEDKTNVLVVTAKKVAQDTVVKLRADAMDMGGAFCEMELVIKPKVQTIKIYRTDDINKDNNLSGKNIGIDPERDSMTFSLTAVNEPSNASQMVTWKISNTKVADFKDNEDGTCTVYVKGMGTAAITATATDGSKTTATTTLNVTSLVSSVEIEGSNMVVRGKTVKLTAAVYPKSATNKTFKWESLYPDIASVNPNTGEVRGIKEGFAIIRATASDGSGKSGTHSIWVKDPVEDFDIMVPDGDDNIKNDVILTGKMIGLDPDNSKGTYTVAARIFPDTACQDVEWKSSNEKVATVEPAANDSRTCIITAKTLGKVTITMSSVDGSGRKASVTVNISTLVKNIKITGGHYVGIDKELQLKAEVWDKDATNKAVIWKSDNPRAATVDENGLVKGIKDGDAVISAEAADGSGIIAEHRVYVIKEKNDVNISAYTNCEIYTKNKKKYIKDMDASNDIDISNRKTYVLRLKAELSNGSSIRDGVPMDINWSTSNKSIAEIEPGLGDSSIAVVTIRKAGTVTLTATTAEGYEKSESVTMTVTNINPYVEITGSGHRLGSGKKMKLSTGGVPVDWISDNEQIAKVNKNGQVTACKDAVGTVNIIATSIDGIGEKNSDSYTLYVSDPVQKVDITMNNTLITGEKIGIDLMTGYKKNTSIQLDALLDGMKTGEDVVWKSSNKNIAERDEYGYVDFKKNGTVTFTATAGDGSNKKGKVTFVVAKQVTGMVAAEKEINLGLKKSVQLNVDYTPLSCTVKKAIWESSDPSIVSVNKNTGKVSGKAEGYATITATALYDSSISCDFYVYVNPAVSKIEIVGNKMPTNQYQDVIGIDLSTAVNTAALTANLYTKVGKEYVSIGSQKVKWSSSNKKIAEVDENGVVTAKDKSGEVTITATALDGSKKSGKVKIYIGKLITSLTPSDQIKNGITLNLRTRKTMELAGEFSVAPITATNQAFTYTSSNKKIVTVNAKGKVTGKKEGEAEIIITPKDGSGHIITIPVIVER